MLDQFQKLKCKKLFWALILFIGFLRKRLLPPEDSRNGIICMKLRGLKQPRQTEKLFLIRR